MPRVDPPEIISNIEVMLVTRASGYTDVKKATCIHTPKGLLKERRPCQAVTRSGIASSYLINRVPTLSGEPSGPQAFKDLR